MSRAPGSRGRGGGLVGAVAGAAVAGLALEVFLRAMGPGPHTRETRLLRALAMAEGALLGALGADDSFVRPPWPSEFWERRDRDRGA